MKYSLVFDQTEEVVDVMMRFTLEPHRRTF